MRKRRSEKMYRVSTRRKSVWKDQASWQLLLLCIPALVAFVLFNYVPMVGAFAIPFRDYKFSRGIFGSEFVGFKNFTWLFTNAGVGRAFRNTLMYGVLFLIFEPLVNMFIALLLFEITSTKLLKVYQTIITFPNFMSMVVVGYVTYALLSPSQGLLNRFLGAIGLEKIDVYMNAGVWPLILTLVNLWKGVGMGSMMYFAALVGIDPALYEAVEIDGGNRFHKMRYISIPHLISLVCIFTIMGVGKLVNGSFDLNYIIPRDTTILYSTTDILNTYEYRALANANYSTGSTLGLVQAIASTLLVIASNAIVKKISPDNSLF